MKSLSEIKNKRAPGEDDIVSGAVKEGGEQLLKTLIELFNKCLT